MTDAAGTEQDPIIVVNQRPQVGISAEQYDALMRPLNGIRVASRKMSGKELSYLEAWDVRAHLIRTFGFGNFDIRTLSTEFMGTHDYKGNGDKPMVEVIYRATVELTIRSADGYGIATYSESAVGSATGGSVGAGIGDLHDNALKSATSDAMKRCAINLGTQFGLSLYNDGTRADVIKGTIVKPLGVTESKPSEEQQAKIAAAVGGVQVTPEEQPDRTEEAETSQEEPEGSVTEPASQEESSEPTPVGHADMEKRRREMFALFNEAGFPKGNTKAAREERIGYCVSVVDRTIESSAQLTYDEMLQVIAGLRQVVDSEKVDA